MPELPDIVVYIEALTPRIVGQPLQHARVTSPLLLRTAVPPLDAAEGRLVTGLRRIGKRIVWEMAGELFLVFHLMIAGRFKWRPRDAKPPGRIGLAAFDFPQGTLLLTEASKKHRASLHVVEGVARLQSASHTLKRALTLSRRDGGAWTLQASLPRLRLADPAHSLRRKGSQLLRHLSDRRAGTGRPGAVAPS
ncbi:MAG: DNA-formamidopyrimidine glycosylase family protein [Gemmatimonadales bacterium]|nr:DNA-formamidopyrimidine glycosylase family protein [Gemmatimonadales bacterium]